MRTHNRQLHSGQLPGCHWLAITLVFAVLLLPITVAAEDEPVEWDESYRRVTTLEKGLAISYLLGSVSLKLVTDDYREARLKGPVGPDTAVRSALVSETEDGRNRAASISDLSIYSSQAMVAFEALYVGFVRNSPDAGTQMFWIGANALGLSLFVNTVAKYAFRRERPGDGACYDSDDPDCPTEETVSFYSGHTAAAFSAAGVLCNNAFFIDVYTSTDAWTNYIACGSTAVLAGFTGALRIAANKHYFTDVLTGAVVGAGIGFLYPWLAHYATFGDDESSVTVGAFGDPDAFGLTLFGEF